jgi:site-specific DNA recombinase
MGGVISLGYRVENRKLIIDEAEAETVGHLFDRYLELGSVSALAEEAGVTASEAGRREEPLPENHSGEATSSLSPALEPTLHRQDQASRSEGEHLPLIDARIFAKAQKLLADGAPTRSLPPNREHRHLLHWHRLR